jgi:hypothetical protein
MIATLPNQLARAIGALWDARQNEPVFGTDTLREYQAHESARRLSQAYRRALGWTIFSTRAG